MFEHSNLVRGNVLSGEYDRPAEMTAAEERASGDFHVPESFYRNPDITFVLASALVLTKGAVLLSADLMRECFEQMTDPTGNISAVIARLRRELTAPNLYLHLLETGRFPVSGDAIAPYNYQGWLLAQIIVLDTTHPQGSGRWAYWARTHHAQGVTAADIPPVEFHGEGDSRRVPGLKHLQQLVDYIARSEGFWDWQAFTQLMDWLGFGMNLRDKPPRLKPETQKWLYENFNLELFLTYPGDYIGDYICSIRNGKWNPNAFFPTPIPVVKFMVGITCAGAKKDSTVLDPCTGTGRMLLLASNYSLRLYGVDIDPLMILAAQMNFTMYAPWGIRSFPEAYFERAAPALPQEVDISIDPQQWLFDKPERIEEAKKRKNHTIRPAYAINKAIQGNLFDEQSAAESEDIRAENTAENAEMGKVLEFPTRRKPRRRLAA